MSPVMHICPGCRGLFPNKGRCETCRREKNAERMAQPHRWVYDDTRWRATRLVVFRRDGWRCRIVESGERCTHVDRTGRTLHAHHTPLSVRQLLDRRLDPFEPRRSVTVCHSHHSRIEAALRSAGTLDVVRPRRFPEANLVYRLPGGNEDNDLWCERVEPGRIYSEWELTEAERHAIADGGRVYVQLLSEPIPPVSLGVVARAPDGSPVFVDG